MILPTLASPLRPIIRAFYNTSHQVGTAVTTTTSLRVFQEQLALLALTVSTQAPDPLDLIIEQRIGVAILPLAGLLTTETLYRRVRHCLRVTPPLEVALLMAFTPVPRLARINAPLSAISGEECVSGAASRDSYQAT